MIGFIADAIASLTTILLPAYLSYKALRTSDPAQITPWLIYFVILTLALLIESWTYFIIGWFPFYAWLRLIFLSYLALPQTQGAKLLYLGYVEPFIVQHEKDIDIFIGDMHRRLEEYGLGYLNTIIDFIRDNILHQTAPQSNNAPATSFNYAQNLLTRFAMPAVRPAALSSINDVYGVLSGVAGAAISTTSSTAQRYRETSTSDPSQPESWLLPRTMQTASTAEKSAYFASQREKLSNIMRALDKEQQSLDLAYGFSPPSFHQSGPTSYPISSHFQDYHDTSLSKSRSEQSFEQVSYEDARHAPITLPKEANMSSRRSTSGNWVTGWLSSAASTPSEEKERPVSKGWSAAKEVTDAVQGMSSSIDTGR